MNTSKGCTVRYVKLIATAACATVAVSGCSALKPHDREQHKNITSPAPSTTKTERQKNVFKYQRIGFAVPSGFHRASAKEKDNGNAAVEFIGNKKVHGYTECIYLFSEPNSVGNIGMRVGQLKSSLEHYYEDQGLRYVVDKDISVPGAVQTHLLRSSFKSDGDDESPGFSVKQVDIDIATERNPQYGIQINGPEDVFDEQGVQQILRTLRVNG